MLDEPKWIILDTETTGLSQPIFTVDLAAQKMHGWEKLGKPFRRLLNHGCEIPPESSRVHGYTREILERDGSAPTSVYEAFAKYAGKLPVVAYNLEYDWNKVLLPEWQRLGISPIGTPGFCALKLAQRLLDPVPAGNCKLQTLRQYYRLPENGAHTAMGDVLTVIDLMQKVLRPLAEKRGLDTWAKVSNFTQEKWFPARLSFGKFKGRLFQEAQADKDLRSWLEWLSESTNEQSSSMGRWYLEQLEQGIEIDDVAFLDLQIQELGNANGKKPSLIIYTHPELDLYQRLVEAARNRLAELEQEFGIEKSKVDTIRSKLFQALRPVYQKRDRLRLLVQYRKAFIDRLLAEGEQAAEATKDEYQRETDNKDQEYDSTESSLKGKRELNEDDASRLKLLWKKLVQMFHPDLHQNDPEKGKTFEMLTQAINDARERGDIDLLEQIAKNPDAFIRKQGWASISIDQERGVTEMRALYEHLQARILELIALLDDVKTSVEYEIHRKAEQDQTVISRIIAMQRAELEAEIEQLLSEAEQVATEARELTDNVPF